MTTDIFRNHTGRLTSPPERAAAILPDDASDLALVTARSTWADTVTLVNIGGAFLPIRIVVVLATGTSAGNLVGLW